MTLGELIKELEKLPQDGIVSFGFGKASAYRGDYCDLAFKPIKKARIGDMLQSAKGALGRTFEGYKGGEYQMDEYTECWIDEHDECNGNGIGYTLLEYWKKEATND